MLYVGLSQWIFSIYLFKIHASNISHVKTAHIVTPIWGVKRTLIWHFRISVKQINDFVKSFRDISKSTYLSVAANQRICVVAHILYKTNHWVWVKRVNLMVLMDWLIAVWHQGIGNNYGSRWQSVSKTVAKIIVMIVEESQGLYDSLITIWEITWLNGPDLPCMPTPFNGCNVAQTWTNELVPFGSRPSAASKVTGRRRCQNPLYR